MQLSHSHRFIFIHIFKTAGTSMRAALEPLCQSPVQRIWRGLCNRLGVPTRPGCANLSAHARAEDVRAALPAQIFDNYYKFAFVRNPWDWQVSWYHYVLQNEAHHEHAAVRALPCFDDYLRWRIDHPVWTQKDFVANRQGELIVDFVGRFETLEADFQRVCLATGVRARLPHLNRSRHDDYRLCYSNRSLQLVADHFQADIDFFGYRFEPLEVPAARQAKKAA